MFLLFFVGFWIHQIVSLENVVNQLLICECSVQNHKGIFHDLVVFLLVSFCLLFFYIVFLLFTLLSVSKVYLFILKAAWYAGSLAQLVTTFFICLSFVFFFLVLLLCILPPFSSFVVYVRLCFFFWWLYICCFKAGYEAFKSLFLYSRSKI